MSKPSWLTNQLIFGVFFLLAIALRVYGATVPAHPYDIATYESWSRLFWVHGPGNFFASVWSDYLPLPILTYAPISLLADYLSAPFGLTFKLVHITIELILIILLLIFTKSSRYLLAGLLLYSPAIIGNNAFWGQVDTIPALLGLLSLSQLTSVKVNIFSAALYLGLAVAYKPIMVLIAPILWILSFSARHGWWKLPIFSSLIFFLTAIPTGGVNFVTHIIERTFSQAGTYPYLTVNAFNFWSLKPVSSWIPDSTSVFSLSGHSLGLFVFGVLSLITLNNWRLAKFAKNHAGKVIATILVLFFTFTTRMHERHLLFALPFLTIAALSNRAMLWPLAILTSTFTLNLYAAYYWVLNAQTWPFSQSTISLISWVTTITAFALGTIWDWHQFFTKCRLAIANNKILTAILIIALSIRIFSISHPPDYIFDEVYHAFTAREYLNNNIEAWEWWTTPPPGVAYEWTHPPVAKYFMTAGMLLFGENSFGWRIGSVIFGVISILWLYLLVFALTHNRQTALISAFLVSIEGLHIAQSRIAMNDIYMLTFFIWALYAAVKSRWKSASLLYGLALATKWSALYGIIPLGIIFLHSNPPSFSLKTIFLYSTSIIRYSLIGLITYVLSFTPFILAGHTWEQWWELHRQMWYYHTHLVATHAYQSTPLQWIFAARPVWYYVNYLESYISNIYAQSNPAILWLGLVALVFQLKNIFKFPYFVLYTLYFTLFLPWVFSPRIMFFYHYLPSSVFLTVILANWISSFSRHTIFYILLLCSLVFILITPLIYGLPTNPEYWNTLFALFPSWK